MRSFGTQVHQHGIGILKPEYRIEILVREKLSSMNEAGASSQKLAAELEYSKNDVRYIVEGFHSLDSNSNPFHYFLGNIVRHIFEDSAITPRLTSQALNLIGASVSHKYLDTPKLKPNRILVVSPLRTRNEYAKYVRCIPP
jgi:hypothetical protein